MCLKCLTICSPHPDINNNVKENVFSHVNMAMQHACAMHNIEVVKCLLASFSDEIDLYYAFDRSRSTKTEKVWSLEIIKILVEYGFDIGYHADEILKFCVIDHPQIEVLKYCLSEGCILTQKQVDNDSVLTQKQVDKFCEHHYYLRVVNLPQGHPELIEQKEVLKIFSTLGFNTQQMGLRRKPKVVQTENTNEYFLLTENMTLKVRLEELEAENKNISGAQIQNLYSKL